ncbi:MAG: DUF1566 domain-containing protein [bacterium]
MKLFFISVFFLLLISCGAFSLEKMGNEGQECFNDGSCHSSFTCKNGICVDDVSNGEKIDSEETDGDDENLNFDDSVENDNTRPDEDTAADEELLCNRGELCWDIVPTQQKRCFNESGTTKCDEVTSEYYGQDGLYADTSNRGFENIKIGDIFFVFDNITELLWYKTASEKELNHQEAKEFCQILNSNMVAEKTNWRLPYFHEMVSIVNFDESFDPLVDGFYFPFIEKEKYWTLTNLAGGNYFYVDFSGDSQFYAENEKTSTNYAICVSSDYIYDPQSNFKRFEETNFNGDTVVEDKLTGLMWQKPGDYTNRIWKDALKHCEALEFAEKTDWRLPNVNELHSLATYEKNPELQTTFPNLGADFFWSSTTNANKIENAWVVEFKYGILKPELPKDKNENYIHTLCVRGGK